MLANLDPGWSGLVAAGAVVFAAGGFNAQEIGWLDLTDPHPRERIRAPHTYGAECGGGAGFTSNNEVTITLVSLDKASYSLSEEVTYEVKLQNSGKAPVEIPWTPDSSDFEPADSLESYTFLHAAISLTFTDPGPNRTFAVYANSYGSPEKQGSTRKLLPGEWILVRARQKLEVYEEWWWTKVKNASPLNVKASSGLLLDKVTYSPGEKSDSSTDHSVCIPVNTKPGASLDVALWPAKLD